MQRENDVNRACGWPPGVGGRVECGMAIAGYKTALSEEACLEKRMRLGRPGQDSRQSGGAQGQVPDVALGPEEEEDPEKANGGSGGEQQDVQDV